MKSISPRIAWLSLAIILASGARGVMAQNEATDAPADSPALAPGHSYHGEAFNDGPRQAARLLPGMPEIQFEISTTNELTRKFFTQGIGQLHGFWYFEAERSFRQAARCDTNCAMAYWGMAMANHNNRDRARGFVKLASEKKERASKREVMWIDALAEYRKEAGKDEKERRREYLRALERIVFEYPDDVEAKAFLAFQIWDNGSKGLPITSAQAVESLLKEIFAAQSMHPAHHYRIHLWDGEKDELSVRALTSAALCGQSSPGIAHMWHMPGHTFNKLKRYEDMAWQQEAAVRVDNASIMADRILPDQIHNYAHNSEWLCQTYGRIGRVRSAVELAKNMVEMPRHPRFNTLDKQEDNTAYDKSGGTAFHGRRRLLEELMRYELWDELIALSDTPYLEPTDLAEEQARRARALGVAYFSREDSERGRQQIAVLGTAARTMRGERQAVVEKAETKAKQDKKSPEDVSKAMLDALNGFTNRLQIIENYITELKAFEAVADGRTDDAKSLLEQAREMSKESKARMQLQLGDHEKAEALAKEALEDGTNQVQLIANYADVLWRIGKTNEATEAFRGLRERSACLDLQLPIVGRLRAIAQSLSLPEDWRETAVQHADAGKRPEVASLGPFLWHPYPAPAWTLADRGGEKRSLEDYRGKPVLVLFYLGRRCSHCLEQLNAFASANADFSAAGIAIVAISSDNVDGLKRTTGLSGEPYPFPLVSDEPLDVFRAYHAYDDFEEMPLHGAFLVDAHGLVRWQDISFEPFKDTHFLLAESRRLFSFPGRPEELRTTRLTSANVAAPDVAIPSARRN